MKVIYREFPEDFKGIEYVIECNKIYINTLFEPSTKNPSYEETQSTPLSF